MTDLVSVTVIAHETALADVLAKSILILGRTAGHEFAVRKNIAALFVDAEGIATRLQILINTFGKSNIKHQTTDNNQQ